MTATPCLLLEPPCSTVTPSQPGPLSLSVSVTLICFIPSGIAFVPQPRGMCWEALGQHCPASLRAVVRYGVAEEMLTPGATPRQAHATSLGPLVAGVRDPGFQIRILLPAGVSAWVCTRLGTQTQVCLTPLPHRKSLVLPFCPHRDRVSVAIVEMDQAKSNLIFFGNKIEFSTL